MTPAETRSLYRSIARLTARIATPERARPGPCAPSDALDEDALWRDVAALTRDAETPHPSRPVTHPYPSVQQMLDAIRSATRARSLDAAESPVDLRPIHGWRTPTPPRARVDLHFWSCSWCAHMNQGAGPCQACTRPETRDPEPEPAPSPRARRRTRETRVQRLARLVMIAYAEARNARRRSGVSAGTAGPSYES